MAIFCTLVLQVNLSRAQTPIAGVVNSYYEVIDIVPAKACVRVVNPAGLTYNDRVMLVQMKGASINTSASSSAFGDTSSLNRAGNYEIATVCAVVGDSVFFIFMHLNQYNVNDKVQLVRIPHYISAQVTDTLKPAPWNNTTGTGGILAISVEQDLILDSPIYGDSSGFRGGSHSISSGTCGNFFPPAANAFAYNASLLDPQNGAYKGEGIAEFAVEISGGKGAPANGGGGGNNHNNGGAGGANLTAGGIGGGNSSSGGCTASNPGRAGKPLSNYGGTKIFPGGGGGAGHSNFVIPNQRGGGNGGGIIFVEATNIIGNNMTISANGHSGGNAIGDGASGGGAGGTIILQVNNYVGPLTIETNGGGGGNNNNVGTLNRCYGGGGGGSGGTIYFSGGLPSIDFEVNGGAAGLETGRNGCNPMIPSDPGETGLVFTNYTYRSSLVLENNYCSDLLPVELIDFRASYQHGICLLKWKIANPETTFGFTVERSSDGRSWTEIQTLSALPGVMTYQATDPQPRPKTNYYRLRMTDINQVVNYSSIQKIFVSTKEEGVKVYPNPVARRLTISGQRGSNMLNLFDLSGKLIWTKVIDQRPSIIEIEIPELPAGIYLIKIDHTVTKITIR